MPNIVSLPYALRDQVDRAHAAWHYLGAVSSLLDQATESSQNELSLVNTEHLAMLIGHIYRDLGDALDKIEELGQRGAA